MLGEMRHELGIAAGVLVQILHTGRAGAVGLRDLGPALLRDLRGGAAGLFLKLLALGGLGALAATRDDKRIGAIRVRETEMQDGNPAHRNADDMRLRKPQPVEHVADIVAGALLRITLPILWYVGGRVTA